MKKLIYLLLFSLTMVSLTGCDDSNDIMDTKLLKGQWQVVSEDSPEYSCIYNFTTQSDLTWSWGTLTTYYLSVNGTPIPDKVYSWHVSDPANDSVVHLDITFLGDLDSDDPWENTDYFIVEKLTPTQMILRRNTVGDSHTRIKFTRYENIKSI